MKKQLFFRKSTDLFGLQKSILFCKFNGWLLNDNCVSDLWQPDVEGVELFNFATQKQSLDWCVR